MKDLLILESAVGIIKAWFRSTKSERRLNERLIKGTKATQMMSNQIKPKRKIFSLHSRNGLDNSENTSIHFLEIKHNLYNVKDYVEGFQLWKTEGLVLKI